MNKVDELLKIIRDNICASFAQRSIEMEIARRDRTKEGNAMETLLIETRMEQLRQAIRIVEEQFAKLTPKD